MDFLGVCFKIRGSGFELKIADNQCLRVPPYIARGASYMMVRIPYFMMWR